MQSLWDSPPAGAVWPSFIRNPTEVDPYYAEFKFRDPPTFDVTVGRDTIKTMLQLGIPCPDDEEDEEEPAASQVGAGAGLYRQGGRGGGGGAGGRARGRARGRGRGRGRGRARGRGRGRCRARARGKGGVALCGVWVAVWTGTQLWNVRKAHPCILWERMGEFGDRGSGGGVCMSSLVSALRRAARGSTRDTSRVMVLGPFVM